MTQGSLTADAGIAGVIRRIYTERLSGTLTVERDGVVKKLFFQKGSVVFSETNEPGWKLGELAVSQGLVTQQNVDDVIVLATGKRLGKVLCELNFLTEDQLNEVVRYQVLESVYPLFSWTSGSYAFDVDHTPVAADIALALSTANVVMEGVRRISDPELIQTALGSTDRIVALGSNPLLRFQSVSLKPKEGFILSRIDGMLTIDEICSISPVPEEETLRCLFGLFSSGILELRTAQEQEQFAGEDEDIAGFFTDLGGLEQVIEETEGAHEADRLKSLSPTEIKEREEVLEFFAKLPEMEFHQVLGIEDTDDKGIVRKAYYKLAKRYHPDRHHRGHLAELHDKFELIFARVNESYEAMRDPKYKIGGKKKPVSKPKRKPEDSPAVKEKTAEECYRQGLQLLESGEFYPAVQELRRAVQLNDRKVSYQAALGRSLAKNPKWRKEAETHLLRAAEMDPNDAEHFAQLGKLYAAAGLQTKSERYFAEAIKRDPTNQTAKAAMPSAPEPEKPDDKGIGSAFKNLFADRK